MTELPTRRINTWMILAVACSIAATTACDPDASQRSRVRETQKPEPVKRHQPSNNMMRPTNTPPTAVAKGSAQRRVLGISVEGQPIEALVFGDGPDCVLILATIHGNEDAGTPLVQELSKHLMTDRSLWLGRKIVLMPLTNPDGMKNQTRGNVNGVDLNRNYPATNFQPSPNHGPAPLSEPESQAIERALKEYRPARIVSIHQPLRYGTECIDHDGPAESLAMAMSQYAPIPVRKLGSRPGSLGSYAGVTLGIPIITLELPAEAKDRDGLSLWNDYGEMLLAAISYPQSPVYQAGSR